jgi:hypothetical protein
VLIVTSAVPIRAGIDAHGATTFFERDPIATLRSHEPHVERPGADPQRLPRLCSSD